MKRLNLNLPPEYLDLCEAYGLDPAAAPLSCAVADAGNIAAASSFSCLTRLPGPV